MININSNKELFEETKFLSKKLERWAAYVQNDIEMSTDDIKDFHEMTNDDIDAIRSLKTKFLRHFSNCNKVIENG